MGFQIKDKDGNAIKINELDKEAAAFWNKEVHESDYACPQVQKEGESNIKYIMRCSNWFDVIGWNINAQRNYTSGWRNVVHSMIADSIGAKLIGGKDDEQIPIVKVRECTEVTADGTHAKAWHLEDEIEESIYGSMLFYNHYIELINHWMEKGYTPHKTAD